jgi:hypothetical protein
MRQRYGMEALRGARSLTTNCERAVRASTDDRIAEESGNAPAGGPDSS